MPVAVSSQGTSIGSSTLTKNGGCHARCSLDRQKHNVVTSEFMINFLILIDLVLMTESVAIFVLQR